MNEFYKNLFKNVTKLNIAMLFVSFCLYCYCSYAIQKSLGIYGTVCVIGITSSLWITMKNFITDPMMKSFDDYIDKFMKEYPEKVNEIYRQNYKEEYLDKQHGILEELHREINEMAKSKKT